MPGPLLQPSEQPSQTRAGWRFAVDRGGTFTDVVGVAADGSLHTAKVLSHDPARPGDPALHGIRTLLDQHADAHGRDVVAVRLGTTVATNALLERNGAQTLLVTSTGFRDALAIGYQERRRSRPARSRYRNGSTPPA
jgi:5-oxoprolinase (ATP-hydrolysing)